MLILFLLITVLFEFATTFKIFATITLKNEMELIFQSINVPLKISL